MVEIYKVDWSSVRHADTVVGCVPTAVEVPGSRTFVHPTYSEYAPHDGVTRVNDTRLLTIPVMLDKIPYTVLTAPAVA